MDDNRIDAIVYPTTRRIAPVIGGNQVGSNAGLSAQTGFPAITVPAGFTSGGFPVGVELLARQFDEPTLIALAFGYEQANRHRRPPQSTPRVGDARRNQSAAVASSKLKAAKLEVTARGNQSIPPSDVQFRVTVRFTFDESTRALAYELTPAGSATHEIAGVYLHRRGNRPNGGVAYVLTHALRRRASGIVTLSPMEAADLKAGKLYIAAVSGKSPLRSARANLTLG